MSTNSDFLSWDKRLAWIETLPGRDFNPLPSADLETIRQRLARLRSMPLASEILESAAGMILDVGPGAGISSMALAQFAPRASVIGIEMDAGHLISAWPACLEYPNLRLAWGVIPGTPSNPRVARNSPQPPRAWLPDDSADYLFSYLGMSRSDIFSASGDWAPLAKLGCVLVYPKFWRGGRSSLSPAADLHLQSLCKRQDLELPEWPSTERLPGFLDCRFFPLQEYKDNRSQPVTIPADPWILWLSGIYDATPTTFYEAYSDQSGGIPVELELEVMVGFRRPDTLMKLGFGGPRRTKMYRQNLVLDDF